MNNLIENILNHVDNQKTNIPRDEDTQEIQE